MNKLLTVALIAIFAMVSSPSFAARPHAHFHIIAGEVTAVQKLENDFIALTVQGDMSSGSTHAYGKLKTPPQKGQHVVLYTHGDGAHWQIHDIAVLPEKMRYTKEGAVSAADQANRR